MFSFIMCMLGLETCRLHGKESLPIIYLHCGLLNQSNGSCNRCRILVFFFFLKLAIGNYLFSCLMFSGMSKCHANSLGKYCPCLQLDLLCRNNVTILIRLEKEGTCTPFFSFQSQTRNPLDPNFIRYSNLVAWPI